VDDTNDTPSPNIQSIISQTVVFKKVYIVHLEAKYNMSLNMASLNPFRQQRFELLLPHMGWLCFTLLSVHMTVAYHEYSTLDTMLGGFWVQGSIIVLQLVGHLTLRF
jgi:hypothetical protein